jgi:hypothetical protein
MKAYSAFRIEIRSSPETNDHEVRFFADGEDIIDRCWNGMIGLDPDEILVRPCPLQGGGEQHRATVARCSCGVIGCGSIEVEVSRSPENVEWTWGSPSSPETLRFLATFSQVPIRCWSISRGIHSPRKKSRDSVLTYSRINLQIGTKRSGFPNYRRLARPHCVDRVGGRVEDNNACSVRIPEIADSIRAGTGHGRRRSGCSPVDTRGRARSGEDRSGGLMTGVSRLGLGTRLPDVRYGPNNTAPVDVNSPVRYGCGMAETSRK